jgi:ABC-type transport system substrate-binding protein
MSRTTRLSWIISIVAALPLLFLSRCSNDPYRPGEAAEKTYYTYYYSAPTKLDPARGYYSHEIEIMQCVYESAFTYHYLKRPYELVPQAAVEVPKAQYFDAGGKLLPDDAATEDIARVEYVVKLKQGMMYQPHPCFAKGDDGESMYRDLTEADMEGIETPNDFPEKGTREVLAQDFVLQIRRLADPRLASPVLSTLERSILGLEELGDAYAAKLDAERQRRKEAAGALYNQQDGEKNMPLILDYMAEPFEGAQVIDKYTYKVVLKRRYPQQLYWMAMTFFCAMPQEALDFYAQPPLAVRQIDINHWPVGSGAYYLDVLQPNKEVRFKRNPNFRKDFYPTEGDPEDQLSGLLDDAGKQLPFIDNIVMFMDKEAIPSWNKFQQGYYDGVTVRMDTFDQAVSLGSQGDAGVSKEMAARGVRLEKAVESTVWYLAFNMLDPVVGGYSEKQCKLRQAISIALDYSEFVTIFRNGRGVAAQGPIAPGIFGYEAGAKSVNPYTDVWDEKTQSCVPRSLDYAKELMAEAGYPGGVAPDGRALTVFFDHNRGGDSEFPSEFEWYKGRFALLGIELRERGSDLSRYRKKVDKGDWQIAFAGWSADYPDPENYLFLLAGRNGRVESGGENQGNYANPKFDELFAKMETMENGPERKKIIDEAVDLVRHDAPWAFAYHPVIFALRHEWAQNIKPHEMTYGIYKYRKVDTQMRTAR